MQTFPKTLLSKVNFDLTITIFFKIQHFLTFWHKKLATLCLLEDIFKKNIEIFYEIIYFYLSLLNNMKVMGKVEILRQTKIIS